MCMMRNSGEKEACEVAKSLAALDGRVTKVEERMNKIDGFKSLSVSIGNLGHDVGERVNLIEKKVVDEKAEWGKDSSQGCSHRHLRARHPRLPRRGAKHRKPILPL